MATPSSHGTVWPWLPSSDHGLWINFLLLSCYLLHCKLFTWRFGLFSPGQWSHCPATCVLLSSLSPREQLAPHYSLTLWWFLQMQQTACRTAGKHPFCRCSFLFTRRDARKITWSLPLVCDLSSLTPTRPEGHARVGYCSPEEIQTIIFLKGAKILSCISEQEICS